MRHIPGEGREDAGRHGPGGPREDQRDLHYHPGPGAEPDDSRLMSDQDGSQAEVPAAYQKPDYTRIAGLETELGLSICGAWPPGCC